MSVAQQVLTPGAWLAIALAVASVAVLAGGRMAEQTRRVGQLKAAGGTPALVAAVLLAERLFLALQRRPPAWGSAGWPLRCCPAPARDCSACRARLRSRGHLRGGRRRGRRRDAGRDAGPRLPRGSHQHGQRAGEAARPPRRHAMLIAISPGCRVVLIGYG